MSKIGWINLCGKEMKDRPWETMKKIADIGYMGFEGGKFLLEGDVNANIEKVYEIGLKVLTVGASKEILVENPKSIINNAKALGATNATLFFGPADSKYQILQDAEIYNKAGKILKEEGIKLCYHNHEHEFNTSFNGVRAIDILADNTDPNYLYFEVDCAWSTLGGCNTAEYLKRMSKRIPAIHIKDLKNLNSQDRFNAEFSAVGTGVVDIKKIVSTAIELEIEWVIVEQDRENNLNQMEILVASYLNLKEMGFMFE